MEEIINYINEAGGEDKAFMLDFVTSVVQTHGELVTLQLDRPLIRMFRPDGTQFGTLHVPTAEYTVIVRPEEG